MRRIMTKQEQIEKIQEIINDCYIVDSFIAAEGSEGGYIDTEEAAKAIVEAGYGDVSVYEAERKMLGSQIKVLKQRLNNKYVEIEQLKEENEALKNDLTNSEGNLNHITTEFKQLQTNAETLAWGVRDLNHENYELTKKIKQAKIDALNKAKEKLDSAPNGWAYTTYIDELIEEIENE